MKVLFLDVDGVLNSRSVLFNNPHALDSGMCDRLAEIVNKTGAKVVLSSTWRLYNITLEKLKKELSKRNIEIHSCTPELHCPGWNLGFSSQERGMEIKDWLDKYGFKGRFVILDDLDEMLTEQKPFFVQTNFEIGLTQEQTEQAIRILNE